MFHCFFVFQVCYSGPQLKEQQQRFLLNLVRRWPHSGQPEQLALLAPLFGGALGGEYNHPVKKNRICLPLFHVNTIFKVVGVNHDCIIHSFLPSNNTVEDFRCSQWQHRSCWPSTSRRQQQTAESATVSQPSTTSETSRRCCSWSSESPQQQQHGGSSEE